MLSEAVAPDGHAEPSEKQSMEKRRHGYFLYRGHCVPGLFTVCFHPAKN